MEKKILLAACSLGFLAIIFGAFGAHALKKTLTIEQGSNKTVKKFIEDFRENLLQPYLKTETIDPSPVIKDSILRVYGSNYISLVKNRKYAKPGTMKGLILLFTKQNSS
jgi:hypothetical protein